MPYVTEEVWSWWREGSIHRSAWPARDEVAEVAGADPGIYAMAADVLTAVRKEKALAKVSLKVPAEVVTVADSAERLAWLASAAADVREAGRIASLETTEADEPAIVTVLGEPEPA
jgi:valyl-tRNA synthetase